MKPLQIALLVVAGAVGGAVVMKVVQPPQPTAPAQPPAEPAAATPEPVAPASEPAAPPSAKPAPFPQHRPVSRPKAAGRHSALGDTGPVDSAPNAAPVLIATAPTPAPAANPAAPPEPTPESAPAPAVDVAPPPPPPPPPPRQVTLNAGLLIPVRLIDGLTTERNNPGDTFAGSLDQPLVADGLVIAEKGARVEGRVVSADKGGKVQGVAALAVELTRVHLSDGQSISVHTDSFEKHAEQTHKTDAAKIGGGAIIGAAIGAIAGGGKGAAIGAGVGGGAGAGDVLLTRGKPAALPSETRISFRLNAPITVTERRS
jgi:hypothetical protein